MTIQISKIGPNEKKERVVKVAITDVYSLFLGYQKNLPTLVFQSNKNHVTPTTYENKITIEFSKATAISSMMWERMSHRLEQSVVAGSHGFEKFETIPSKKQVVLHFCEGFPMEAALEIEEPAKIIISKSNNLISSVSIKTNTHSSSVGNFYLWWCKQRCIAV
ncbi:MAG: hypothetical protein AAFO69_05280 [Bacteroidota bacterium]